MENQKELLKEQEAKEKKLKRHIPEEEDEEEEKLKKPILLIFLYCLTLIFLIISGFFTISTVVNQSVLPSDEVKVGELSMELIEANDTTIKLINSSPMSDEKASDLKPFLFKISNNGTYPLRYRLRLVDVPDEELIDVEEIIGKTRIDNSKVKYSLIDTDTLNTVNTGLVSNLTDEVMIEKEIPAAKVDNYALRLWIDENAGNEVQNKFYAGRVILEIEEIIEGD